MSQTFLTGKGIVPLLMARAILLQNQTADLAISLNCEPDSSFLGELSQKLVDFGVKNSKFGRIFCWVSQHDHITADFVKKLDKKFLQEVYTAENYEKGKKRKEKEAELIFSSTHVPLLADFVREGYEDSVEFRRLARKFLKKVKNHNADTLLVLSADLCSEKALIQLKHLAKSQIHVVSVLDFLPLVVPKAFVANKTRNLVISSPFVCDWTKKRAENVLKSKIAIENFVKTDF